MKDEYLIICQQVLALRGFSSDEGIRCYDADCKECPFSSYKNKYMLCSTDTDENYIRIAREYVLKYSNNL